MRAAVTIRSILAPTDFSEESRVAFEHALRLAVALKAELHLLHVEPDNDQTDDAWIPPVLETLVRWEFLPEGAVEADIARLGMKLVTRVVGGMTPYQAILEGIALSHADLVVMATHGRTGVEAWRAPSITAKIARKAVVPLMFIPHHHRGFVNRISGASGLQRILLPVAERPHPGPAFDAAAIVARALPAEVCFATLHVGGGHLGGSPEVDWMAADPEWKRIHLTAHGDVVSAIVAKARDWNANLVVCVTEGRRGVVDSLLGSTVERLLGSTPSPVLVVPHEWGTEQVGTT